MPAPGVVDHLARHLLRMARYSSRWVETSVGRVHLLQREGGGELPPVVLFHGFGSAGHHWAPLLRRLRPHVRHLIAIDLPGHGFSDLPHGGLTDANLRAGVLEALDQVQHPPSLVVGNSLGGAAAVRYLHARPERVLGAVLLSPAGAPLAADELADLRALFRIEGHDDAVRFLDRLLARPSWARHLIAPSLRRTFRDPMLRAWLEAVSPDDFLSPLEVSDAPRPLRVIWGRQERVLPQSNLAFWRRHVSDPAHLEEPDGMGHSPHLDDAAGLAARILTHARALASETDR